MKERYNLTRAAAEGVVGSAILTAAALFAVVIYWHYPSGLPTTSLYVGANAIVLIIGLFFFNYSLAILSEKYDERSIGTYALTGTMLVMIAIVIGGVLSPSDYNPKLVTFAYLIAWLIGYWAYSISLNVVGLSSKIGIFKYSGFLLFISVFLLYYVGPLWAESIQALGWVMALLSFMKLRASEK